MRKNQRGNAVIFILLAVVLFGALAYTFMRGAKSGQGNLTAGQAKMKAQELAAFMDTVAKAATKLRARGCSESDISFEYTGSLSGSPTMDNENQPASAPADKSCHVFDPAGGGLTMNVTLSDYQVPASQLSSATSQINHMFFGIRNVRHLNFGTNTADISMHFNFVKPEICKAYNEVLKNGVDSSVIEDDNGIMGDVNTAMADKVTGCIFKPPNIQNSGPHSEVIYTWVAR